MRHLSLFPLMLMAAGLEAQTADVAYFRAVMLPSNEVPATPAGPTGTADIVAHLVRDSSGQVISGNVDFTVRSTFPTDVTFTGLHIHNGPAGQNAGVVINTGLSGTNTVQQKGGAPGEVSRSVYIGPTDTVALTSLRGLLQDPAGYYVNIHTTDFPGGVIRGQLLPAQALVLMGIMSSDNEVPALTNGVKASGLAQVVALGTWDDAGRLTSGEVFFATTFTLSEAATFTGFHIHPGAPGIAGPVAIGSNLPAGLTADANTPGLVQVSPPTEVNIGNALQASTFNDLFVNPGAYYINIHTTANASGVMRAPLRFTDTNVFPVLMDAANETSSVSVKATAPAMITVSTLRNEDGSVATGTVFFDVNYRFPGQAQFTGLHIHDGAAGVAGPVTINMIPSVAQGFGTDTGNGNFYRWTPPILPGAALNTLADLVKNPENHYVNMHTSVDAGGAVRAQLAPAVTAKASVTSVFSANQDPSATTVAPLELVSIRGANLAKVASYLTGWQGDTLPSAYNGASVTMGGKTAPLYYVSPTQIIAGVPADLPVGAQPLVVDNGNGAGTAFSVTVASTAPAIFLKDYVSQPAIVKDSDGSLVTSANPAAAGDTVVVYCTGLGITTPQLATGQLAPFTPVANTATVTATVGGQNADVVSSAASPGASGVYRVRLRLPGGVSGSVPLVLQMGNTKSNTVSLAVK